MDTSYRAIDTMSKAELKRVIYALDERAIKHDLKNNHMDERDNHTTDVDRLVGGAWYDDLDNAVMTTGHIAHGLLPLFGLGKMKGGRVFTENKAITNEPTQTSTIEHLRAKHQDIYSPDGVLISHYTPPEEMRDQSIRPDMPLDATEVVKPPPGMTGWQAFKLGFTMPFRAVGAVLGLGKPEPEPKKRGVKPANKWVSFVKNYASKNEISYRDALKDPKCKIAYNKSK